MADVSYNFFPLLKGGDPEMVNGPGDYTYMPPANVTMQVHALNLVIVKNGLLVWNRYGSSVLANGIKLHIHSPSQHFEILAKPITVLREWFLYSAEKTVIHQAGDRTFVTMHLAFEESNQLIRLQGAQEEALTLHISDPLSGILSQRVMLQCRPG